MDYKLVKKAGSYCVEGLKEEWGDGPDTFLLVRYPEGDCDTIKGKGKKMLSALYDLYQTSDALKDGDTFSLGGKPAFMCSGVHVVAVEVVWETVAESRYDADDNVKADW